MAFIGFLVFGTLIGAAVRMLVAGRAATWATSTVSGAVGGLLGGSIARIEGFRGAHDSGGLGTALLGAFVLVGACHFVAAARRPRGGGLLEPKERPRAPAER